MSFGGPSNTELGIALAARTLFCKNMSDYILRCEGLSNAPMNPSRMTVLEFARSTPPVDRDLFAWYVIALGSEAEKMTGNEAWSLFLENKSSSIEKA
jgi:hypothetical protein